MIYLYLFEVYTIIDGANDVSANSFLAQPRHCLCKVQ